MAQYDLGAIAFPTLDETVVIAALGGRASASLKRYLDGQTLFQAGDRDFKFFVVKSGHVEIVDPSGETPRIIAVHQPGEFTGDVAHLTGSPALVSAIARGDCQVYEIESAGLRQLLDRSPSVGDVILQAFIARRQLLRESGNFTGVRIIGSRYSRDTFRIREFLAKNRVPFTWLDLEGDSQVKSLLDRFAVSESETPVVAWRDWLLRNPSTRQLSDVLGLRRSPDQTVYDLIVVGAGPAGLAAAVYGASEGLRTLVLERLAPGGQVSGSMRVENYLGFPTGLSGSDLADRAVIQAHKFGARLSVSTSATSLAFDNAYALMQLDSGERAVGKCLLIATGADYRRLSTEGCERFEGCGVYYAATWNEAELCRGMDVVIVGGGNAAGQAAVFLAGQARKVFLVIRGDDLYKGMSSYLARRIEQTDNIEVLLGTTVARMSGDDHLTEVELVHGTTGERRRIETAALFSFIGAVPRTDWLPKDIDTDDRGFVVTGSGLTTPTTVAKRDAYLLETSRPGVFAAGDVRAGSIKRVAAAVGEGAMAVQFAHEYLRKK